MLSENPLSKQKPLSNLKKLALKVWQNLSGPQKELAKKIWSVITYKWKWQIAMNASFMMFWLLDRTNPTMHEFDMKLLTSLPIPQWALSYFNA